MRPLHLSSQDRSRRRTRGWVLIACRQAPTVSSPLLHHISRHIPAHAVCTLPVRNLQPRCQLLPTLHVAGSQMRLRNECCTSRAHRIEIPVACAAARTFFRSPNSPPITFRPASLVTVAITLHPTKTHVAARTNRHCDRHARALCHRPSHLQETTAPACDAAVPDGSQGESAGFFGRLTISRSPFTCSPLSPVTLFLGPNGVCGVSSLYGCSASAPSRRPPYATVTQHGAWTLQTRGESRTLHCSLGFHK